MKDNLVNRIGSSLKDLRLHHKISQKELAKDICTQSYVSMIEKGEISPAAHILYSFALRLGVDISYFFDAYDNNMFENIAEFRFQVRAATEKNDFSEVNSLIKSHIDNPYFKTNKMYKFITYHEGLCEYYLNKNLEGAMEKLKQTLTNEFFHSNTYFQEDFEALLSIAVIYTEEKQWENAEIFYTKSLKLLNRRPRLNESILGVRLYYNYVRYLYSIKSYSAAITHSEKGIRLCKELKSYYLFGELYYYKGLSYLIMNEREKGIASFDKAKQLFKISDQENYNQIIDSAISKYL
jgi:transcriptional regulator with XRE-family HTH domain